MDLEPECCPGCGLKYSAFRTGLTYKEVYDMFWSTSDDPNEWKYKRRSTVLGKWRQVKRELWDRHIYGCAQVAESVPF